MSTAQEWFEHVAEWQVIVCKQCRCAVWPAEVAGHLRGRQHRQPVKVAKAIADQVQGWGTEVVQRSLDPNIHDMIHPYIHILWNTYLHLLVEDT